MSRRLVPLLVALLFLTCAAVPLVAQDAEIARLQRKADSLARLWEEADALADLADSLARVPVMPETDTLVVGGLTLITNEPSVIRAAAERAWPVIDSFYGTAAAQLRDRPYRLQVVPKDSVVRQSAIWGTIVPGGWDAEDVRRLLLAYTPIPTDDRYQRWAGGNLTPSSRGARVDLEESYIALVTSHYQIGTECFGGRTDRCRTLLGLDSLPDPLRLFSTFPERQKVARQLYAAYNGAGVRQDLIPCLATSDSSCQAALLKVPFEQLPRPAPQIVRHSLVAEALRVGGREAYARLMADTLRPIPARLEAAAGMPLDSVLARWQADVVAARPKPVALPPFGAVVGIGWGVIFGLMALRSSRWRIA